MKFKKVCKTCHSENVVVDAWAEWDEDKQEYVLKTVFDYEHCENCEGETTIINVEIKE
jgi:hypothetical protein